MTNRTKAPPAEQPGQLPSEIYSLRCDVGLPYSPRPTTSDEIPPSEPIEDLPPEGPQGKTLTELLQSGIKHKGGLAQLAELEQAAIAAAKEDPEQH